MFLWAVMVLEYVDRASTRNGQLKNLSAFPVKLTDIYEEFMVSNARKLAPDDINVRKNIFMLIVGAARPLAVDEISAALAAKDFRPTIDRNDLLLNAQETISRLCWPLVTIFEGRVQLIHASVKEFLLSCPATTTEDSVRVSEAQCNYFLLGKCLTVLNQDAASIESLQCFLIQHNSKLHEDECAKVDPLPELSSFYQYSCLFWHSHLCSEIQDKAHVDAMTRFLAGPQFVTWAESVLFFQGWPDVSPIFMARAPIVSWYQSNPSFQTSDLPDTFFIRPYSLVLQKYREDADKPLMQYLILHRLGTYYNMSVDDFDKLYKTRKEAAQGLKRLLGDQHPLTLQAMTEFCIERLPQLELREAESELEEVIKKHTRRPETDTYGVYYAKSYLGVVQLHRTHFEQSVKTQEEASQGLSRLLGNANKEYLKSRLFLAWALEAQGILEDALAIHQSIWDTWIPLHSAEDPLSMMVQVSIAVIFKKLGKFADAERNMLEVFENRKRVFGVRNHITFDTAMNLAFLYRKMNRSDEAKGVLDAVKVSGVEQLGFERYCQYQHAQALLFLDDGQEALCAELLGDVLHRARKENRKISRELLWVRLTLSQMAPVSGYDPNTRNLFSGLTTPRGACSGKVVSGEVIKQALQLAKESRTVESKKLLERRGVEWAEEEYFWILPGGPFAGAFGDVSTRAV